MREEKDGKKKKIRCETIMLEVGWSILCFDKVGMRVGVKLKSGVGWRTLIEKEKVSYSL